MGSDNTFGENNFKPELNKGEVKPNSIFNPSGNRKAMIKLDKNFHVYIHGDKSKIEEGEDDSGRFIKLYFVEAT